MISIYSEPDRIDQLKAQLDEAGIVYRITNRGHRATIFGGLPAMTKDEARAVVGLGDREDDDGSGGALERDG